MFGVEGWDQARLCLVDIRYQRIESRKYKNKELRMDKFLSKSKGMGRDVYWIILLFTGDTAT